MTVFAGAVAAVRVVAAAVCPAVAENVLLVVSVVGVVVMVMVARQATCVDGRLMSRRYHILRVRHENIVCDKTFNNSLCKYSRVHIAETSSRKPGMIHVNSNS